MLDDLFAGIPVADYAAALAWYERLFGAPPSFVPVDTEAVWEIGAHRFVFIERRPEHAGHARHLAFVDDLDALVARIAGRGLAPAAVEAYENGVRKVAYRDPDGNEFGFGGMGPRRGVGLAEADPGEYTPLTVEERYTATPESRRFAEELERGLNPRSPDTLFDMAAALGLGPSGRILDIGCGTGWAACRLAERTPGRIVAVDPVPALVATAQEAVRAAGHAGRIAILRGSILALPIASATVDLVWSSDMLGDGFPIPPALRECHRILRPGGAMLVYKTFAGDLLEPREAARLYRAVGGGKPEEERMEYAEAAFLDAGFRIEHKDVVAGEWREYRLAHDERSPRLGLDASRLLRQRGYFVDKYGEARYEQALADAQWLPFILLGKLVPVVYLLRKEADSRPR